MLYIMSYVQFFFTLVQTHWSVWTGFPQRLENLENESGHGKVMDSQLLVGSKKLCSDLESQHFPTFSAKRLVGKIMKRDSDE